MTYDLQMITKGVDTVVLKCLRKDIISDAAMRFLDNAPHPTLSAVQRCRLDDLIYRLLDIGDLATACNLQFMFKHRNQVMMIVIIIITVIEIKVYVFFKKKLLAKFSNFMNKTSTWKNICFTKRL